MSRHPADDRDPFSLGRSFGILANENLHDYQFSGNVNSQKRGEYASNDIHMLIYFNSIIKIIDRYPIKFERCQVSNGRYFSAVLLLSFFFSRRLIGCCLNSNIKI